MAERRFLLVDADVLPEVFVKVLQAKELLASGAVSNISAAAKQAGISRSAFYKYKDTVFDAETGRESITVVATLLDKTGALQGLLSGISAAGASIVTITQSRPENGAPQGRGEACLARSLAGIALSRESRGPGMPGPYRAYTE